MLVTLCLVDGDRGGGGGGQACSLATTTKCSINSQMKRLVKLLQIYYMLVETLFQDPCHHSSISLPFPRVHLSRGILWQENSPSPQMSCSKRSCTPPGAHSDNVWLYPPHCHVRDMGLAKPGHARLERSRGSRGTGVLEGTKIGWGICHRRSHSFIHILLQTKHRIHCTRH